MRIVPARSFSQLESLQSLPEAEILARECQLLHRQIFSSEAPDLICKRYVEAHHFLQIPAPQNSKQLMLKILRWNLDCEALELFWKLSGGPLFLKQKLSILFFLTESNSTYFETYYQKKDAQLSAWLQLFHFAFRSFFLGFKGVFLAGWLKIV